LAEGKFPIFIFIAIDADLRDKCPVTLVEMNISIAACCACSGKLLSLVTETCIAFFYLTEEVAVGHLWDSASRGRLI
jgi:hypothetical protein